MAHNRYSDDPIAPKAEESIVEANIEAEPLIRAEAKVEPEPVVQVEATPIVRSGEEAIAPKVKAEKVNVSPKVEFKAEKAGEPDVAAMFKGKRTITARAAAGSVSNLESERTAEEKLAIRGKGGFLDQKARMPRSLEALWLAPMRRHAVYRLPACDLQLRSYSVRNLEFFCDFALRAAYYLGLPTSGPVPLPRLTERWTVPKSNFIFKKSQENFSRITLRRLIRVMDAHPETVQVWLAFLQKHAYYGIGMKANMWEFSKLSESFEESGAILVLMSLLQMWERPWTRA
jgi:ribosomal protein S10